MSQHNQTNEATLRSQSTSGSRFTVVDTKGQRITYCRDCKHRVGARPTIATHSAWSCTCSCHRVRP